MLGVTPNIRHCIVNKQVVVDSLFSFLGQPRGANEQIIIFS